MTVNVRDRLLEEMASMRIVDCHSHTQLRSQYYALPERNLFRIMHYFSREMQALLGAAHVTVSLGERIDGRVDDEAREGQRSRESRVGEHDPIVPLGDRTQDVPELRLRGGEIVMTAPEPSRVS